MKKIIESIVSFINPDKSYTIGLSSFRVRNTNLPKSPKPVIKENNALNFGLLHK